MTRKEMLERLDGLFLECLNDAFVYYGDGNFVLLEKYQMRAVGVLLAAYTLGVITRGQFSTIYRTLSEMTMTWRLG